MTDVFAPATLGPVALRNRTIKAATFEARTWGGQVSDSLIDFHARIARGGVAMTTVAYLAVAPEGRTAADVVVVGPNTRDRLARLADAVHAEGAALSGQLGHAGPVANGRSNGQHAIAASRMPSPLSMQMIRSATERDLARVTRAYVSAARLLVGAGFDALELHMAHSYLISSFLAPGLNRRKDHWGGSLDNRMRLARQVARAVREEVGGEVALIAKLALSDGFPGGVSTKEGLEIAQALESDGNLDAFEMSTGSSLMNPMYLFRGNAPRSEFAEVMPFAVKHGMKFVGKSFFKDYPFEEGFMRDKALDWRSALSTPLILLGGVWSRPTMEQAMADGFDFVALGRALIADPDLINQIAAGEVEGTRCTHCNLCMPSTYDPAGTHCPEFGTFGPSPASSATPG